MRLNSFRFWILAAMLCIVSASNAQTKPVDVDYVDGFDYPVGDRGRGVGNAIRPLSEGIPGGEFNSLYTLNPSGNPSRMGGGGSWWNYQDVGSYYSALGGLHPGEDWNGSNDIGSPVYAVANGQIVSIKAVSGSSPQTAGWFILVRHWLPDGGTVDSLYMHVAPSSRNGSDNRDGTVNGTLKSQFANAEGAAVRKGALIARIARATDNVAGPHLHFEMRDRAITTTYPNDNNEGYYTDQVGVRRNAGMTRDQVAAAFALMRQDGIIDPSDYIDFNRTFPSVSSLPDIKLNDAYRVEIANCIALGIMANTDNSWLNKERPIRRGEIVTLLKRAGDAFQAGYVDTMPNVSSGVLPLASDPDLAAPYPDDFRANILTFARKGIVSGSNTRFRPNDWARADEALSMFWKLFQLGSASSYTDRIDRLQNTSFRVPTPLASASHKPTGLDYDLSQTSAIYHRFGGKLQQRQIGTTAWIPMKEIAKLPVDPSEPIRRCVLARAIINMMHYRASKDKDGVGYQFN